MLWFTVCWTNIFAYLALLRTCKTARTPAGSTVVSEWCLPHSSECFQQLGEIIYCLSPDAGFWIAIFLCLLTPFSLMRTVAHLSSFKNYIPLKPLGLFTMLHCFCDFGLKSPACCIFGALLKSAPKMHLPLKLMGNAPKMHQKCTYGSFLGAFLESCGKNMLVVKECAQAGFP